MNTLMKVLLAAAIFISIHPSRGAAQSSTQKPNDRHAAEMLGMNGGGVHPAMRMRPQTFLQEIQIHATSGTGAEPNSTPTPMWMGMHGAWMWMFHANVFLTEEQQTSPRGGGKFFSTNWFMPMAQRVLGRGQLTLKTMFSLEPATVSDRQYPLLFQQGETAFGLPIVDGQHPHDFFMELAALYDFPLSGRALLSFYAAPVGDPALGPVAYPHRTSASENPVAALGHHQEDSTHIADDVITAGWTYGIARVEASGFHGREPNENRWNIDQGAIDSWSTRLTVQPGQNWSAQYSYGYLTSPEQLYPSENQTRATASMMYNHPSSRGNLAGTLLWGRTRSIPDNAKLNSYLLELTWKFDERNYLWTRIENAGRTNELLIGENPLPPGFQEAPLTHVQAYTFGYDREILHLPHLSSALGAQMTVYAVGDPLKPIYGSDPIGGNIFLRIRPF